jgi:hypothetical protein
MTRDTLLASLGNLEAKYPSSTPTPTINTPASSESSPRPRSRNRSRRTSPFQIKIADQPDQPTRSPTLNAPKDLFAKEDFDIEDDDMAERDTRSSLHRPNDGRSHMPLLKEEGGRKSYDIPNGNARPAFHTRRSTFQSRSPDLEGSAATKKKYTYAAFFLLLSLVSFVIQTETAVYIQHELGWKKAYAML